MFITPKPVRLIRRIIYLATVPDAIVLDSFAGSGTTAQAVPAANADIARLKVSFAPCPLPFTGSPSCLCVKLNAKRNPKGRNNTQKE